MSPTWSSSKTERKHGETAVFALIAILIVLWIVAVFVRDTRVVCTESLNEAGMVEVECG